MSGGKKSKHYFAAIPARALADRRLDGGRFQLLAAIALHARMNEGQGCWASSNTLAELSGLEPGTVRNYIGDLVRWNYVERQLRPGSKTQRTLFLVFDAEADLATLKGEERVISGNDTLGPNVSSGDPQPVISRDDTKILREDILRSASAPSSAAPVPSPTAMKINSAEAGCRTKPANLTVKPDIVVWQDCDRNPDAKFLRTWTEWVKAERLRPLTKSEVRSVQRAFEQADQIQELRGRLDDRLGGWAYWLCEELSMLLIDEGHPVAEGLEP